jgi:hypothetical protein
MQAKGRIHRQSILEQQKGPMAGIGDVRLVLGVCLPLGLREAALVLLVPALPLALHAKLTGQAYDAKHTASVSSSTDSPHYSARPRPCSHCRCHR